MKEDHWDCLSRPVAEEYGEVQDVIAFFSSFYVNYQPVFKKKNL